METLGEQIRKQREKLGLLLKDVSVLLEMDPAILSKVERSERKATRIQIIKIAEVLKFNKKQLILQYLSEKIAYQLLDEDDPSEILKVAEEKVIYYKIKKRK